MDTAKAWWSMKFEVEYAHRRGNAFQDFFADVMGRRFPDDYRPVRPWGQQGDRKNDGYLPSQRQLFQVYAPSEYRAAELVAKMDEDWAGAIEYWEQFFDTWIFVHNDVEGLAPAVDLKLQELDSAHEHVRSTAWGRAKLRNVTLDLGPADLTDLFGPPVTSDAVAQIGVPEIKPLIRHLGALPPVAPEEVRPVPADKADINLLSDSTRSLLYLGMRKSPLVAKYFNHQRMAPDLRDRVAGLFRARYERHRDAGLDPDTIFGELQDFVVGGGHHPVSDAGALAVLAFFFEECDIYEEAPVGHAQ
jgi:hypothetical protein